MTTTTITKVGSIYNLQAGFWDVEVFFEGGSRYLHFFTEHEALAVHVGQEILLPDQHLLAKYKGQPARKGGE